MIGKVAFQGGCAGCLWPSQAGSRSWAGCFAGINGRVKVLQHQLRLPFCSLCSVSVYPLENNPGLGIAAVRDEAAVMLTGGGCSGISPFCIALVAGWKYPKGEQAMGWHRGWEVGTQCVSISNPAPGGCQEHAHLPCCPPNWGHSWLLPDCRDSQLGTSAPPCIQHMEEWN